MKKFLSLSAIILGIAGDPSFGQSCSTDQSYTGVDTRQNVVTSNISAADGQSFTAGMSGQLNQVRLDMDALNPGCLLTDIDVRVDILQGDGVGGTQLATQTVSVPTSFARSMQLFTFTTPATIAAGSMYTIRVTLVPGQDCGSGEPVLNWYYEFPTSFWSSTGGRQFDNGAVPSLGNTQYFETCVGTSTVPNTQLKPAYCTNYNLPAMNSYVYCNAVPGATGYKYLINGPNVTNYEHYQNNNAYWFTMAWVPGVEYGSTYSVEVKARVGTTWGNYSTVCTVVTPGSTLPSVITSSTNPACPSGASLSTQIFCTHIPGATDYKWEVTGVTNPNFIHARRRNSNMTNWYLSWHSGITASATYNVRVSAKVGGVWGNWGPTCTITVPAANPNAERVPFDGQEEIMEQEVSLFPNPANDMVTVELDGASNELVQISNALGQVVLASRMENGKVIFDINELPAGFYSVNIYTSSGLISKKLVK